MGWRWSGAGRRGGAPSGAGTTVCRSIYLLFSRIPVRTHVGSDALRRASTAVATRARGSLAPPRLSSNLAEQEVTDPEKKMSPAEAKKKNPAAEVGIEILAAKATDLLRWIAAPVGRRSGAEADPFSSASLPDRRRAPSGEQGVLERLPAGSLGKNLTLTTDKVSVISWPSGRIESK
jgi:hypothetical protein